MIVGILSNSENYASFTTDAHKQALWNDLILQNVAYTGVGDAGGLLPSSADGDLWASLHTAEPGLDAADQSVNEVAYPGYARISGGRNAADPTRFLIAPAVEGPDFAIAMPAVTTFTGSSPTQWSPFPIVGATANTYVITHIGFGVGSSGATKLLGYGPLMRAIPLKQGMGVWLAAGGAGNTRVF